MSIYFSYILPWTVIVGELFTLGAIRVELHLPLLWFVPVGFLGTAIFRLYDVRYMIDGDGVVSQSGLINFRKRTVRVRFEDIRSVKTHQDLIGRLFDIGQIEIRTAAASDLEIFLKGVSAPLEIHSMIESEKAQRQNLTGRMAKVTSNKLANRAKVALVLLIASTFVLPWNKAVATPEDNNSLELSNQKQIKSIRDVQANEVQPDGDSKKSLRAAVVESTLEGDEKQKEAQSKLENEAQRLRTAEKELLKKNSAPTPSKENTPQSQTNKTPPPIPTTIPTAKPTVIKYSVSTPTIQPTKAEPKIEATSTEVSNKISKETQQPTKEKHAVVTKAVTKVSAVARSNDLSQLRSENSKLKEEIAALQLKAKTGLTEVDNLRVKLMVTETQVERINKILEECSQRSDSTNSNYITGAQQIDPKQGTSRSLYATVIGNSITPRTGPGNSFSPISTLRRGERVPVEDRQGDWYKVLLPSGAFAWVHTALVKLGEKGETLNLPGAPSYPKSTDIMGPISKPRKSSALIDPSLPRETRLDDVDKEAFRLLEQLKIERESESGS